MSSTKSKKTVAKSNGTNPYAGPASFSEENLKKFDEQVDKRGPTECWPWKGRKTGQSGDFVVGGKIMRVGKYTYLRHHRDADPNGRYLQECKPDCCNPAHVHTAEELKGLKKANSGKAAKPVAKTAVKPAAKAEEKKGATKNKATAQKPAGKEGSAKKGSVDTSALAHPKPSQKKGGKKNAGASAKVEQAPPVAQKRAPKRTARR
jgi:hypothetical protein